MPREGAGQLPALLLDRGSLPLGPQAREGEHALHLPKHPSMQVLTLLLLAGVMLCCFGILLSLPATTSDMSSVPSALAGANMGHLDGGVNAPAPLPDRSYPLTPAEEAKEANKLPANIYLLMLLVLTIASFGASVIRLLITNAQRRQAICGSVVGDRAWLATAPKDPSLLRIFRL
jgi:hypothetical protein